MSEDEKTLLNRYGITAESKIVYVYKQHRYENAKDAVNFAKLEEKKEQDNGER